MQTTFLPCPACGVVSAPHGYIKIVPAIALFSCSCGQAYSTQKHRETGVEDYYHEGKRPAAFDTEAL